jgi:hypothetical protein
MGVSLNPFDFFKALMEKRAKSREQMIEWLEEVREDGKNLAQLWFGIITSLEKEGDINKTLMQSQQIVGFRLQEFYNLATVTADGRVKDLPRATGRIDGRRQSEGKD